MAAREISAYQRVGSRRFRPLAVARTGATSIYRFRGMAGGVGSSSMEG